MELTLRVYIELFSLGILLFILWDSSRQNSDTSVQHRIFGYLVVTGIFKVLTELFSWIADGKSLVFCWVFNLLDYLSSPLAAIAWFFYARIIITGNEKEMKKPFAPMMVTYGLYAAIVLTTPLTGWLFDVGGDAVYRRGALFPLSFAVCYTYIMLPVVYLIRKRKSIPKHVFGSLLLFPLPPIAGGVFQATFYGLPAIWSMYAFSTLIVYINIQNRHINTDYVTGAFSKQYIEALIAKRIQNSQSSPDAEGFSGYFIDLDKFKTINDGFGHREGDAALRTAKLLIDDCVGRREYVARYGGDEFIIVSFRSDPASVKELAERLKKRFDDYNASGQKPYKIEFSIGFAIYQPGTQMSFEKFINGMDRLMFKDKEKNRAR